jgi:LysM repeat protein
MKRHVYLVPVLVLLVTSLLIGPAHADGETIYIVRRGDTMHGIAAAHGITATELARANGLRWSDWVYVGQRLRVPSKELASSVQPVASGVYVVRPGDTMVGIAATHGTSVYELATANNLRPNMWVYVGQRLKIPESATRPRPPSVTTSTPGSTYIVRPKDTLGSIAARHRITVSQLAQANGLHTSSWVYIGQRLQIPQSSRDSPATASTSSTTTSSATTSSATTSSATTSSATTSSATTSSSGRTYVVRPGDTLVGIATRHRVSVSRLAAANGLRTDSWVYVGQLLVIPDASSASSASTSTSTTSGDDEKWIDINLSTQTLVAYSGQTPVLRASVSTGTWRYPTVVGTFRVYIKYVSTRMRGPGWDRPNVPYTMYFYRGYAIHGTYWHDNFGTPMSHGCVNLSVSDARWLFNWAPVGIKVVTHY